MSDPDQAARRLAAESLGADDPTGWFDKLYDEAERGTAEVPWDRGTPHSLLAEWVERDRPDPAGRRLMVVGCGYGRDSEYLAGLGFETVAFDLSESAIRQTRQRFPASPVTYVAANLLDLPPEWIGGFDLVVESMTVQALPDPPRRDAIRAVSTLVAPGGTLLVIAAAREESEPADGPPWPLTRSEVEAFATPTLHPTLIEHLQDQQDPTLTRWRAQFHHTPHQTPPIIGPL